MNDRINRDNRISRVKNFTNPAEALLKATSNKSSEEFNSGDYVQVIEGDLFPKMGYVVNVDENNKECYIRFNDSSLNTWIPYGKLKHIRFYSY